MDSEKEVLMDPSTAQEAISRFRAATVVRESPMTKVRYQLRKLDLLSLIMAEMADLPDYTPKDEAGKMEAAKAAVTSARDILQSHKHRPVLYKKIIQRGVVSPKVIVDGVAAADEVPYDIMDDGERLWLFGAILDHSGFGDKSKEFFRQGGAAAGSDPASIEPPVSDPAAPPAPDLR